MSAGFWNHTRATWPAKLVVTEGHVALVDHADGTTTTHEAGEHTMPHTSVMRLIKKELDAA